MKLKKLLLSIVAFVFIISVLPVTLCFAGSVSLVPKAECAPYGIFQQSEGVGYTVKGTDNGFYIITDYFGEQVQGNFTNGEIQISELEIGHYNLSVASSSGDCKTEFAVVPDKEKRRDSTYNPLAFSAMATYTYTTKKVTDYDAYAKTISLAGVNYVREFLNWKDLLNLNPHVKKNQGLIEAYNNNGIDVMLMLQDIPGENSYDTQYYEKGNAITYDVDIAYNAVRRLLELYPDSIDAIEFLNEPDDLTEMDTADRYASMLKAASIAASDINRDIKVSTAGLAKPNSIFAERFLQNDINDYIDIYDTHQYRNYSADKTYIETDEGIGNFMGDAVSYGLSNKRLWMSEYGYRAKYDDPTDTDLSEAQFRQAARTAPIALVRGSKSGVDKMFWFIHGYLKEDGINGYGTLTSDHAPNYVYSALSAFTNALGNAGYSRDIEISGAEVSIYSDGNEEVACVWSETERTMTLPVNNGKVIITDIMGRENIVNVENSSIEIVSGPDIQYIRAENGFKDTSTEVVKYDKENKRKGFTKAQKLVMTPVFSDESSVMAMSRGYSLDTENGASNEVKLNIYNYNETPVTVSVNCISEGGWSIDNPVQTVTVPQRTLSGNEVEGGLSTVIFNISGNKTADIFNNTPLVFTATSENEKLSDVVTYITSSVVNYVSVNGSDSVTAWKLALKGTENNAASSTISQDGTAVKMTCSFDSSTKNKACRIEYNNSFITTSDSSGISFKCTSPQEPEAMLRVWLTDEDNDTFYSSYTVGLEPAKTAGGDYTYVFPFENFKWGYGKGNNVLDMGSSKIKIGIMNPSVNSAEFSFRDLGVVQKNYEATSNITASDFSYSDGIFTAKLSEKCAKYVKLLVLGNVFYGKISGDEVSVKALLPAGTHKAEVFVYDISNRVHKSSGFITVSEEDAPDVTDETELADGAFATASGSVTVRGKTDLRNAGKTATLIVYPSGIPADKISFSDLLYVDETVINGQGQYSFLFDIKNYSSDNSYTYALNVGGSPIRSTIESYEVSYDWSGAKIRFFRTEKSLKVVTAMNYVPENMNLITGMYDKNNKLLSVLCEDIAENISVQKNEFEYSIPSEIVKIATYLWSSDGNIIPLQIPNISYRD